VVVGGLFISAFSSTWRGYRASLKGDDRVSRYVLISSLALQAWFLMYGFSGNGLYGWQEMFLYVSAVSMAISVRISKRGARLMKFSGTGATS